MGLLCLGSLQAAPPVPFFEQHCADCHDADTKKGGLDLTALSLNLTDPENLRTWVKVHKAVSSGEMPPKKKSRPPEDQKSAFLSQLHQTLLSADAARVARSGRVRMRRMTRAEYENSLADLLALPRLHIQPLLPTDGSVAGYEKIGDGLDLSPAHLAAYAEAAEKALSLAIATRSTPPPVFSRRIYPAGLFKFGGNLVQGQFVLLKDKAPDPAFPIRGGFEEKSGFVGDAGPDLEERKTLWKENKLSQSQSAVGLLNPNLAGYEAALNVSPIYPGMYRMKLSTWGFHWDQGKPVPCTSPQASVLRAHEEGKQQEGGRLLATFTAPSMQSQENEILTWLDAHESIVFDPVSVPWRGLRVGQVAGRAAKHVGPGVALDWFEIEGPLHASWPPESHRRLFGDLPIRPFDASEGSVAPTREAIRGIGGYLPDLNRDFPADERKPPLETVHSPAPLEDARRLLANFLPRAFRYEVRPEEVEPYVALVEKRLAAHDCFEDAMRRAYVAILTSPEFLFHPADPRHRSTETRPSPQYTLASRLAYWLWNGPPDAELRSLAQSGKLQNPETLRAQIDRLLSDRRSDRFIQDFANQWLTLSRVEETTPDKQLYPEYSFLLHEGMVAETQSFLRELIRRNLPARALVQPDFAMLTQRLAEHYGVPNVHGVEVRRVDLPPGSLRGGLLTQASILKLTANGTTTTPVKRGVWVMDRLLNDPAPPPPPGVSQIDPDTRGATTVREQLDRHRSDSSCAACHAKIDPAGFALESFDPVGGLRSRYRSTGKGDEPPEKNSAPWKVSYKMGPPVDPSGALRDGRSFQGPDDLNRLLAKSPDALAAAFVAHLSRYATGTEVSYRDEFLIRQIVASTAREQYGIRSLIYALAESPLFFPR
jgi:mono/diheme cytochrome c family protein